MKKLIGLFVILFITTGAFGQAFVNDYAHITYTGDKFPITIEDWIRKEGFGEIKWENGFGKIEWINYIHFVRGDWLFLLSYEPKEDTYYGSRYLYLYKKNINDSQSSWEKASAIIMSNSWGSFCDDEVDFFLAEKSLGSVGNVKIKDDDSIEITIGWLLMNKVINDCVSSELKYKFVPDGFGKYLFERIYK